MIRWFFNENSRRKCDKKVFIIKFDERSDGNRRRKGEEDKNIEDNKERKEDEDYLRDEEKREEKESEGGG